MRAFIRLYLNISRVDECFNTDVEIEQTIIIDDNCAEHSSHYKWVC